MRWRGFFTMFMPLAFTLSRRFRQKMIPPWPPGRTSTFAKPKRKTDRSPGLHHHFGSIGSLKGRILYRMFRF